MFYTYVRRARRNPTREETIWYTGRTEYNVAASDRVVLVARQVVRREGISWEAILVRVPAVWNGGERRITRWLADSPERSLQNLIE